VIDSSPFHEPPLRDTVPAPSSQAERDLELKLSADRKRKRRAKQNEAAVLAWIESEKGKSS
jgi:hypothetical protein